MINSEVEYKLNSPPSDIISSVNFGPNTNQFLLVTSWDVGVRLYDVQSNTLRHRYDHENPVLDACFTDLSHVYSAGFDNTLVSFDFNNFSKKIIGQHMQGIKCVKYCSDLNCILTGSLDRTVKIWDCRIAGCAGTYNQSEKVFAMDTCGDKLVVATAARRVLVWDIRNMAYALQKRESSLKYQTRALKVFPNKQGFVMSSIEGRVAVDYIDANLEIQKKKYVFKCHRIRETGTERVYPVNTISFHPIHSTFATGGADAFVNIWDIFNQKKLCQFHQYHTSVTSMNFSPNGRILAIALSHLQVGEEMSEMPPRGTEAIVLRKVTDHETKPKFSAGW